MIEQFKALMREHFPDYDLSINECDDQSFLDSEVNAMWIMYQICNAPKPENIDWVCCGYPVMDNGYVCCGNLEPK